MVIRRAIAGDAVALAGLCAAHAAYERLTYHPEGHAERLAVALEGPAPRLYAWLALREGSAVGYSSATVDFATMAAHTFLHMDCLFVEEKARNGGVGALLMAEVRALGRALGCANLQWQTPDWNLDAIRFYHRMGARDLPKARFTLDRL
ncbi:GNAT family N-acetyltransferase [Geothrix sp. PMB-07]|uniref:GNAT family N-acetyltransferase n=1 Tax=Geothrix sp. PMB-07 TaxID=3068640 RepID=UPI002742664C|nr:GNAT family N-acetyltransferase [Geothrix sp. PMB-07]WLT31727.1 GNAT family N-acetyltransferase [Geothrix sp. PMB-07]